MLQTQIWNEDCITGMASRLPDNSIHLTVTSIPFEELFTYSGKVEDVGNNGSTINIREGRFALNMRFVIHQLHRVTAPGCNVAIHIQQLLAYKNQHGFIGRRDFRGAIIDIFSAGGLNFIGEFVIAKNPQAMAQRLNLHSLMFVTGKRNSSMLAPAPNDYVLIFQKPGEPEHPVKCIYDATHNPSGWVTTEEWIRDAHGIWTDIDEFDILDGARHCRESDEEKHVCPLQLEVIRRLVKLYSNPISIQPDVTVLDPFMGIGSTAVVCVEQQRNVVGFELKESYYRNSLRNVERARAQFAVTQADLFSVMGGGRSHSLTHSD
ncbi:MAG TPA: site-specific DNA-methyltransferase [Pyrinomonadaceae bacterium]|nr:site-specific DNA-methyltransferase [Pyrinomonadaceae bacterium]